MTRARGFAATALAGLLAALLLAACRQTPSTSPALGSVPPGSPIDGVVLSIDSGGLTDVRGFTLRTASGQILTFKVGTLENPTQFPPGHLAEHQANAIAVRVFFVPGAGELVVYRLEDAPARPT